MCDILTVCELKNIPYDMHPNIRCKAYGPKSLTDDELLCIILGSQKVKKIDSKDIANLKYSDFRSAGLCDKEALKLVALNEWATRYFKVQNQLKSYSTPDEVANHLMADTVYEECEWFKVLHLDVRNQIIFEETLAKGTRDCCLVDNLQIFKSAILHNAKSIIIAHNHPCGNAAPSQEDITVTRKIEAGCKALGCLTLTDHVIVSRNGYYSFRQSGLITA